MRNTFFETYDRSGIKITEIIHRKDAKGLTINNLNKFVVRHFEYQALRQASTSTVAKAQFRKTNNPSLKAGVSYPPYRGFSPDGTAT